MSAAGDLSAAAQRRTTTMLINLGQSRVPFIDSFPVCQATENGGSALDAPRFAGKRAAVEALLLVMAPFRTEAVLTVLHRNEPP